MKSKLKISSIEFSHMINLKTIASSFSYIALFFMLFTTVANAQIAEFEGLVRLSDGLPEFQLYDNAASEQRIEGAWRESNDNIYFESLYGNMYLGADTSGRYEQRIYISGEDSDVGIRITPKETCPNTDVETLGVTIRRNAFSSLFAKDDIKKNNVQGGDCLFDSNDRLIELFPDNYSNGKNITSYLGLSTKRWSYIYSDQNYTNTSHPGQIRFSGINSGLGDGILDDGVIRGPSNFGADIFARVNDAFVVRINDNNSNSDTGDFVVTSPNTPDIFIANSDGNLYAKHLPIGDRANMQYEVSTGRFFYDNSSARYKENITPLQTDFNKILDAQPVTYTRPGAPDTWEVGYVAEQMDELGLEELLFRNDEGLVENFNYEKMILYVVEVLKSQHTINSEQEKRIKQLEEENKTLISLIKK